MTSFSDIPLEVIEKIINALQYDLETLQACSQTCLSLLPLCRKYLFQSIQLMPRGPPWSHSQLPRTVVLFGRLLDSNPGIADYVRNVIYQTETPYFEDDHLPPILERLHQVRSFTLIGISMDWKALRPPLRESLSNIIQSRSMTRLHIACIKNFPITTLIPCTSLIDLTLNLGSAVVESYEQEHSVSNVIPQTQSFSLDVEAGYATSLVKARNSNNLPVLDSSNLRTLRVYVFDHSASVVAHALINATQKLETLKYVVMKLSDKFTGLAASMNATSLSTLRTLRLEFDINDNIEDPLCGLCEELGAFTGLNVIELIGLEVYVQAANGCKTGDEWGRLDAVLANGFPKLSQVSLHIFIGVHPPYSNGTVLQDKLNKLPEEQFPLLSKNMIFDFSAQVLEYPV